MITESPPPPCHCGNDWRGKGKAIVGWLPCSCAGGDGHRTYECQVCGALWSRPPHTDWRKEVVRMGRR